MSINRMYYGTKKIYPFLEGGNSGECNCDQEYNNGYNNGYNDGYNEGQNNCSGGGVITDSAFEAIGWSADMVNDRLGEAFAYSLQIMNEWDNQNDSLGSKFRNNKKLVFFPAVDWTNVVYSDIMFYDCSSLVAIPDLYTPNLYLCANMFSHCSALRKAPMMNTSGVDNFYELYNECLSLVDVPELDTSNGTIFSRMFHNCKSLKTIPSLNLSKAEETYSMFHNCENLESVPFLDVSNVQTGHYMFDSCPNLKHLGGLGGAKFDIDLGTSEELTYESAMNVINSVYDFNANGVEETRTIRFSGPTLSLLSDDDITTAVNKGWVISA